MPETTLTVHVHEEDGGFWAEVRELPGCFASGDTMEELREALGEAISLYLSEPGSRAHARIHFWQKVGERVEEDPGSDRTIDVLVG